jgi:very-short-patch-repair endonuclease
MTAKNPVTLSRARNLRISQTDAEKKLWGYLRNRTLQGFKFSRQVPIGIYIADFVCRERKLVIELDGATHGDAHEIRHDERRTAFLNAQGYRVHRVWNSEVFQNLSGVLDSILLALGDSPSPGASRHPLP